MFVNNDYYSMFFCSLINVVFYLLFLEKARLLMCCREKKIPRGCVLKTTCFETQKWIFFDKCVKMDLNPFDVT